MWKKLTFLKVGTDNYMYIVYKWAQCLELFLMRGCQPISKISKPSKVHLVSPTWLNREITYLFTYIEDIWHESGKRTPLTKEGGWGVTKSPFPTTFRQFEFLQKSILKYENCFFFYEENTFTLFILHNKKVTFLKGNLYLLFLSFLLSSSLPFFLLFSLPRPLSFPFLPPLSICVCNICIYTHMYMYTHTHIGRTHICIHTERLYFAFFALL